MQPLKLTVVIPCRNEKPFIRECVTAIFACDLPEAVQMSVFVVDGMSDDGTIEEIRQLQTEFPGLHMVENKARLTPFAFNLGIYAGGRADYVQIVGARHILSKNYLSRCLEILQQDPAIWCVGGRLINEYLNEAGKIISLAMNTSFGMGLGNFRVLEQSGFTDTVTSPMYPYGVFEKIGFFDEELVRNQDDDFNFRVTKAGGKIWFEHAIFLKYYVRGSRPNLWRQFNQYGYWKVFVNRKHGAVTTMRQLVPPAFVLFLFSVPLWFLIHCTLGLVAAGCVLLYALLGLGIAFRVADKKSEVLAVWITFPVLHISYGLGYLKGIIRFLVLRKQPSKGAERLSR